MSHQSHGLVVGARELANLILTRFFFRIKEEATRGAKMEDGLLNAVVDISDGSDDVSTIGEMSAYTSNTRGAVTRNAVSPERVRDNSSAKTTPTPKHRNTKTCPHSSKSVRSSGCVDVPTCTHGGTPTRSPTRAGMSTRSSSRVGASTRTPIRGGGSARSLGRGSASKTATRSSSRLASTRSSGGGGV